MPASKRRLGPYMPINLLPLLSLLLLLLSLPLLLLPSLLWPNTGAKYCGRHVYLSLRMSVRSLSSKTTYPNSTKFSAGTCYRLSWLRPPLTTTQYIMYFRFVDDIIFHLMGWIKDELARLWWHVSRWQRRADEAEATILDCLDVIYSFCRFASLTVSLLCVTRISSHSSSFRLASLLTVSKHAICRAYFCPFLSLYCSAMYSVNWNRYFVVPARSKPQVVKKCLAEMTVIPACCTLLSLFSTIVITNSVIQWKYETAALRQL